MSNIWNIFRYAPKQVSGFIATALAIVTTFHVVAAPTVLIEGNLTVANYTNGDTSYSESVSATYDQVVKFKVYYHNRELPDSGNVAENLGVKIDFPTQAGQTQNVNVTIKGDNTNTVTDTATVNLNRPDAKLTFIPGSVDWKHNVGTRDNIKYETVNLADSVVTGSGFTTIENEQPCYEYEAWITFFARVHVPAVDIEKQVSINNGDWTEQVTAKPGDTVKFLLTAKNNGNTQIDDVTLRDMLPAGLSYVDDTVKLVNSNHPNGKLATNDENLFNGSGLNINSIAVGGTSYVGFRATVDNAEAFKCGMNTLTNKGTIVANDTNDDEDTASVKVNKVCEEEQPIYRCDALNVNIVDKAARKVTASAQITKSDDVKVTGVSINFGDGTTVDENNASHTYAKDGNYNIEATVNFDVNGDNKTDQSVKCSAPVSFAPVTPNVPKELPNTGPGSFIAAIFGAGSVATALKGWVASRRTLRSLI